MGSAIKIPAEKRGIAKPFSSPGGKEAWRGLILQRIPAHKVYVEPYAGSATIFFAKSERAEVEVLADLNPDIVSTYVFLRDGADADFEWMRSQDWQWSPVTFKRLQGTTPKTRRERVYRFKYLNLFSIRGTGERLNTTENARKTTGSLFVKNLEKFRDRLQGVKIFEADALEVMTKFDSDDTFHYIDPPWKPVGAGPEWHNFDAAAFTEAIKMLKGKALVSYQGDIELPDPWRTVTIASALGGVATSSEQKIIINFEPPVEKYIGGDPSGTHSHDFDRKALSTGVRVWGPYNTDGPAMEGEFKPGEPTGPHSHLFVINGMVVSTECDGSHAHKLETDDANTTALDGQHSHRIPSANSEPIETTVDGQHQHALGVNYSNFDGAHVHELVIDGVATRSLTPGEFWALFVRDAPAEKNFVPVQKPFPNEHRARQLDPTEFEEFRRGKPEGFPPGIEVIYGITSDGRSEVQSVAFDTSEWSEDDAKAWLEEHELSSENFEPASDTEKLYPKKGRAFPALMHQHSANGDHFIAIRMKCDDRALGWSFMTQRAPIDPAQAETIAKSCSPAGDRYTHGLLGSVVARKGAPTFGSAVRIDKLVVEYGLQRTGAREYFLTCGKRFSGVLRCTSATAEDGAITWLASLTKDGIPDVLSLDVVHRGEMPPDGVSALPSTIEKMIPPELRFWRFKGDEARACRDALAEAGIVQSMRLVDGEFRLVKTRTFVLPYPEFTRLDAPAAKPTAVHERVAKLITWPRDPVLVGAAMAETIGPDDLVETLTKSDRDFLIAWPNTAHARAVFCDVGRPFVMKRDPQGLLFVSSRPVERIDEVVFVDESPTARLALLDDNAVTKRIARLYDEVSAREIPIYLQKNASPTREEMFVLGIVLEPETVDAQKDIYSADEIRKAAHGYMEFHGNRGFMHKEIVNDKIVVLESYVSPVDFPVEKANGATKVVKAGTWLLGYGIRDTEMWKGIRAGKFNGLSIGGSAVRRPRQD